MSNNKLSTPPSFNEERKKQITNKIEIFNKEFKELQEKHGVVVKAMMDMSPNGLFPILMSIPKELLEEKKK